MIFLIKSVIFVHKNSFQTKTNILCSLRHSTLICFSKFKDDKDMAEVINRLRKDKLTSEEFKYVSDIQNYDLYVVRLQQDHEEKLARKLANQKKRLEKIAFEHQLMLIEKAEQEKQKAEQEKQKAEQILWIGQVIKRIKKQYVFIYPLI